MKQTMIKNKQHKFNEDDILKYLDDNLNWIKKHSLSKHLNSCQICNQILKEYLMIEKALRTKPDIKVSPFLKEQIINKTLSIDLKIKHAKHPSFINIGYYIILIITLSIITILLYSIDFSPSSFANNLQRILIYENPSVYFPIRKFTERFIAIYSIFKYLISYAIVVIITIIAFLFTKEHSHLPKKSFLN